MKQIAITYPDDKTLMYRLLRTQLTGLVDGVPHLTANLANTSALLAGALRDINWVGFYLLKDDTLILGPFQGKPACVEIKVGKGVCGTAVAEDCTIIVVPIHCSGKVVGVLDIDSPCLHRFDDEDRHGLECLVHTLEGMLSESLLELC